MNKEQLKQIVGETYRFLNNKGVNFVCYIWERDGDYGGGCNSTDADIGDAMVVIQRLVKHFNINADALNQALAEIKYEQQEN